jgi:hypothetical protein
MTQSSVRFSACFVFLIAVSFSANLYAGWLGFDDVITVPESKPGNPPASKYAATIHISKYADERAGVPAKNIGISTERILGISGKELVIDQEVAEVVTKAVKKRFDDEGFRFVDNDTALYELSGVVKELTYNVKARDEISISIETTLKEVSSGKVLWSGVVKEQDNRFAGVSGNSKSDIANYLRYKLGLATKKTYDAISAILIASRPDLFYVAPGTKPIAGVTVLFAAGADQPAASAVPVVSVMAPPKVGTLVLSTKPAKAKVYLEGVYFGVTPLRAEVEAGIHSVSVKLNGYKTVAEKVSVRKNETTELEMLLEQ